MQWTVDELGAERRFDLFLAERMDATRGEAQRCIESGEALLNGAPGKANRKLRHGDAITLERAEPQQSSTAAEDIPLDVVFEDAQILVINKARGMVVHPAPGHEAGTLVNAVLAHADDLSGVGGELRPGIVHRLDKDTSGLLVIAKNDAAHQSLQAQIQVRTASRIYTALLWGQPKFEKATVDAPIGRHRNDRKKMAIVTDPRFTSRDAVTELTVLERFGVFTLVEARLQTGRTHQIRVHCEFIGHPVVGDAVYHGLRRIPSESTSTRDRQRLDDLIRELDGQALHAGSLAFDHPVSGKRLEFLAPLPDVMQRLLEAVRDIYQEK